MPIYDNWTYTSSVPKGHNSEYLTVGLTISLYACMCVYVCMYVCMSLQLYVIMRVYIYIYTHVVCAYVWGQLHPLSPLTTHRQPLMRNT